jgi:hypothetical protein
MVVFANGCTTLRSELADVRQLIVLILNKPKGRKLLVNLC